MATLDTEGYISLGADRISRIALGVGTPILLIIGALMLFLLVGGVVKDFSAISLADRRYLISVLNYCQVAVQWASVAVVMGLLVRHLNTERVGHWMVVAGGLAYFGLPVALDYWIGKRPQQGDYVVIQIATSLCSAGVVFLLPGLWHVLYNNMQRMGYGAQARRQLQLMISAGVVPRGRARRAGLFTPCWKTGFCRDTVRESCPIYRKRISCWRLKTGCMCDEQYVMGLVPELRPSMSEKDAGVDPKLWAKLKRERCRRCPIYGERQAAKYRVLVPLIFPVVGLAFHLSYKQIAGLVSDGVHRADKFFAFMARVTMSVEAPSGADALTAFLTIWLGLVALCYAIRTLEYLIFELQV